MNPNQIKIEMPASADFLQWVEMRRKLWPEADPEELASEVSESYFHGARTCLVAKVWDKAVGFVELTLRSIADGCTTSPVGYIEGWYVEPDWRKKGVGKRLVVAAEDWARANGCREMASDAEVENERSIEAHLRLGFEEVDRVVQFRKSL